MPDDPPTRPVSKELSDRYYLSYCIQMQVDPEEQDSARLFEEWWQMVHGEQ